MLALDAHKKTNLAAAVVVGIACCLAPFAVVTMISASASQTGSARYLFGSAVLASFIATAAFVSWNSNSNWVSNWNWDSHMHGLLTVRDDLATKLGRRFQLSSRLAAGRFQLENMRANMNMNRNLHGMLQMPKFDASKLGLDRIKVNMSGIGNGARWYLEEAWKRWSCPAPREGYLEEVSCRDGKEEVEEECHVVVPM